jgi:hypothetical protein
MTTSKEINVSQMGFLGWLGILFIGLKLTGFINWPWLWVLAPIWIPLSIGLAVAIIMLVLLLIFKAFDK